MRKQQRLRYAAFVRVRDFGAAHRDLFPESSSGSQSFAEVAAAVTAIESHLQERVLARAEARKVKATTRAAVAESMKVIASTGRRVAVSEPGPSPFRLPRRMSAPVLISSARALIAEARKRQAGFETLGLPPASVSEFERQVDELEKAINIQLRSRSQRRHADAAIDAALDQGVEVIHNLDVLVPNAAHRDPVVLAAWQGARRIDRATGSASSAKAHAPTPAATPAPAEPVTTVSPPDMALGRAS